MAEFRITSFRYTWKGDWDESSVTYYKDDVVFYRGSAWVCVRQHVSDVFDDAQIYTNPGDTFPSPAWIKMADGREWLGDWSSGTRYDPGVLVLSGGNVYLCVASHVSAVNFNTDILNWEVFATGTNFRNQWTPSTRYRVGDVIRFNSFTYQCVLEHTAGTNIEGVIVGNNDSNDDSTFETWKTVVENLTYVGEYQINTLYRVNDLVKYGGSILKCIVGHQSPLTEGQIDNSKFVTYLSGYNFENQWHSTPYYAIGDVVQYGGTLYVAVDNNRDSEPGVSEEFPLGNTNWLALVKGIKYVGIYDPQSNLTYKEGEVVRRGGALWISLTNQTTDDSSLRPFDTSNWELVVAAQNFRGSWHVDQDYNFYDVVYFRGITYFANTPHFSSFDNFPGDNGSGFDYWTILVVGDTNAVLSVYGDMLTYNLKRSVITDGSTSFTIGDESTIGTAQVPIGETDQLLVVENDQGDIGYKTWGNIQRVFFVRLNGVDDDTDPNRGINYFKPWRTIRYALEKADDGFEGTTSIKLSTGIYEESLPLIIPVRTAIVGEELRSSTIIANSLNEELEPEIDYMLDGLVRIGLIFSNVIQGNTVLKTLGNNETQSLIPGSTSIAATIANSLWSNIIDAINFRANGLSSLPTVAGSNDTTTDQDILDAIETLENNRSFIKAEVLAFLDTEYPEEVFNTLRFDNQIDKFLTALHYDLLHPGNYKSLMEARVYVNSIKGSQLEDMFYVRDTTGIRNCTLKGLEGELPALQAGQFYRIPTGGSFVSLDPGWGPNDDRTWIVNRSCYVQNVTTFGTGAIGQKIDGSIHNGGNRSIVSNDFTQVISDGIGAYVANGGRAELVSVFTYYAHIGMFALDGGIVRATNGNSSYGDFGALADGIDPNENVRYGMLNTRTEQAQINSAFAGEASDFILGLEFDNAGQNYTEASYSIVSSGSGANTVQEEFRDDAVFTVEILDNGAGYNQYGNQAQIGNEFTITLATSETVEQADILGMRIIIISGEGTGQYGYVQAYDSLTKILTVYRESDNQPGWDHVVPGTPSRSLLTTGSRYRIEPRPVFTEPPYQSSTFILDATNAWAAAVFGETSDTFIGVTGSSGTGSTVDIVPAPASFNVTKTGRTYSVTLVSGGAGYSEDDTIILDGVDIGGITGEHDITIRVTDVSDDSTNSVLAFEIADQTVIADSGKFVLTPTTGHFGRYSSDGETWTSFDLPTDGNWNCLAAGDNKFVAISSASSDAASSTNGVDWTLRSMPISAAWSGVVYGKPSATTVGVFVAVSSTVNGAAYSTNGTTWTSSTLPTFGDSTFNEYVDIAFGYDKFVAIANSGNIAAVGTWNGTNLTWQGTIMDVIADSSQKDWISIAYGNRRFVAITSTGEIGYSFDGLVWLSGGEMPKQDGSTIHNWKKIRYGQGVFLAVGDTGGRNVGADPTTGPTQFAATSYDGIVWTERTLSAAENWAVIAFGNPDITLGDSSLKNSKPTWIVAPGINSNVVSRVWTGARTLGRVEVAAGGISKVKLWESGSGYNSNPIITVTQPGIDEDFIYRVRCADGVLAQPTFIDKGTAYKTSTTIVTVTGDGFADITPNTKFITIDGLEVMPGPGAQFYIGGRTAYYTAVVVGINETTDGNSTIRSTFQISPRAKLEDYLEHGMEVEIRELYSQVRITGHDFLDVGTGNFIETNYPDLYINYDFDAQPQNEVQNLNGGRVFYTSTDQDGNFRAGEQFAVEQATGIITISADFFDLSGLTELRLAGINVGSTAIIREFSKDPLFSQNSNNVVPTQRAIRGYLQSRLNIGGEDLLTPSFIAGTVRVGPNLINTTAGLTIEFPVVANFEGNNAGISGSMLGQTYFYRSFGYK
jgi:hypothetical protein